MFNSTRIGRNVTFDSAGRICLRPMAEDGFHDVPGRNGEVALRLDVHHCRYYLFAGDSQRSKNNQGRIGVATKRNRN
jgi:hypothetical protein